MKNEIAEVCSGFILKVVYGNALLLCCGGLEIFLA